MLAIATNFIYSFTLIAFEEIYPLWCATPRYAGEYKTLLCVMTLPTQNYRWSWVLSYSNRCITECGWGHNCSISTFYFSTGNKIMYFTANSVIRDSFFTAGSPNWSGQHISIVCHHQYTGHAVITQPSLFE